MRNKKKAIIEDYLKIEDENFIYILKENYRYNYYFQNYVFDGIEHIATINKKELEEALREWDYV